MNYQTCGCVPGPVVPAYYPYTKNGMYACDCCAHMHQPTSPKYPSNGPMQETACMLVNTVPYLIDNFEVSYGTKLSVADSIYTRISSRKDVSCINLAGTIDMTGNIITNTAMQEFFTQTIANEYEVLDRYLDIQKSTIQFKLYFHVEDVNGGVVYESTTCAYAQKFQYHYTDVKDFFVTSFKQIFQCNIPSLDFQGIYNICLDAIEASANVIKTKDHVVDDQNPYYQFTNNNCNIAMQHDTIQETEPDGSIVISRIDLNYSLPFQANLTTRFKMSFTAFMSNLISFGNTADIWQALYQPTPEIIDHMQNQISILTGLVVKLQSDVDKLKQTVREYEKGINLNKGVIVWLEPGVIYQATANFITNNDEEKTVTEAMEQDIADGKIILVGGD